MFKTEQRFKELNDYQRIGIGQVIKNFSQNSETYDLIVIDTLRLLRVNGIIEDVEDDKI